MANPMPPDSILALLLAGQVIPAHPLALTEARKLDERHQRALTRYYHAAGAGGIAVGVHTTQFEIREPRHGLFEPVLELAAETAAACADQSGRPIILVGGICGDTAQAVKEAAFLRDTGYHIGLVSLSAFRNAPIDVILTHCKAVAEVIPIMGFYLQPAVGGRTLPVEFWRGLCAIENLVAIKIAAFNRYQTLDVIRAVAESGRAGDIALYTGNDDTIVVDLLTPYRVNVNGTRVKVRFCGGLLGHWACWTLKAVHLLTECRRLTENNHPIDAQELTLAAEVTDANAAFFDAKNGFAGCIAGIHEVLVRQGLMRGRWCLQPCEDLSPGQADEIDRVYRAYPHLNDDAFVAQHLDEWLT